MEEKRRFKLRLPKWLTLDNVICGVSASLTYLASSALILRSAFKLGIDTAISMLVAMAIGIGISKLLKHYHTKRELERMEHERYIDEIRLKVVELEGEIKTLKAERASE